MLHQAYCSLLRQLEEMPSFLEKTVLSLPSAVLLRTPDGDKSPLLEQLWHIRDCESDLYALRIRRVLNEPRPRLELMDVGVWPEVRAYMARNGNLAVHEFAQLRALLVAELEPLGPEELRRVGVRADGTEINVLGLIEQLLEHDRDHRWRITAILRNYGWPHADA